MIGSKSFKMSLGLVVLVLGTACSEVQFSDASKAAGVGTSGTDGSDPGTDPRDPGNDPGTDGSDPRNPGDDPTGLFNKYQQSVDIAKNQVDFLLVIDDSSSMLEDQKKLAARLGGFADRLSQLQVDWQMCVTVTRDQKVGSTDQDYYWGYPIDWSSNTGTAKHLLKKSQNLSSMQIDTIVKGTIDKIGAGAPESGDERGILAAYASMVGGKIANTPFKGHVKSKDCYRAGAAISVIVISDEDESSIAGIKSRLKSPETEATSLRTLYYADEPEQLVMVAKSTFGNSIRFSFNSIIVNDTQCEAAQDAVGTPSHIGTYYQRASRLTNGGLISICENDYSSGLELFANLIINYQKEFTLKCEPIATSFKVKVTSPQGADITSTVSYVLSGATIAFNKDLIQGTKLDFEYYCK